MNFQMFKLELEKAEEPEIKLPTSAGSSEKQRVPEKQLNQVETGNLPQKEFRTITVNMSHDLGKRMEKNV